MKRTMFTFVLCAMLAAVVGAQTRLGDYKRENILQIGAINGKIPVAAYYTEEQGLISVIKKYYVDVGNKTEGPYDDIRKLTFSPDYKMMAYAAEMDDKWYVVVNGKKVGPYDSVWDMTFSPDGKTLACSATTDFGNVPSRKYLLIDGTPYLGSIYGGRAVYLKDGAIWTR